MDLTIPNPAIHETPVTIVSAQAPVRSPSRPPGDPVEGALDESITGLVTLGTPLVAPLAEVPGGLQAGLPDYLRETDSALHWVVLALTLKEHETRTVVEAVVAVELSGADSSTEPCAVLMIPETFGQALKTREKVSVAVGAKGLLETSLGSDLEVEREREELFLRALNLQTAKPTWHLRDEQGRDLQRPWRLTVLVASKRGSTIRGEVKLGLKVRVPGWLRVFSRIEAASGASTVVEWSS